MEKATAHANLTLRRNPSGGYQFNFGSDKADPVSSIIFLHPSSNYKGSMRGQSTLRGGQNTTILLAENLAARGHRVECLTAVENAEKHNGVVWSDRAQQEFYDLSVAHLYPEYLSLVAARKKCVWVHNPMNRWSRIRKSIGHLLRHRPAAVFLSNHQYLTTPRILPYSSRHIIEHGLDDIFIQTQQVRPVPAPIAVFASAATRNLDMVIGIWKDAIYPKLNTAELHLYCGKVWSFKGRFGELAAYNIIHKGRVSQNELVEAYRNSRLMIYPGHTEETFCNVALEATACGLPIVTMGIGAMIDRVTHRTNGMIVKTQKEMAETSLELLGNDEKWHELHKTTLSETRFYDWANRAEIWEKTFLLGEPL